ncbi:MAG: SIMPL domain-containing protein [Verrucomicrobia bacterium]|nr:SIMPL domain-containing protein [Verrucomicrobiota bacterium]
MSTIGTVQREIPADRLAMTLEVAATEKTIEASVASLDLLLEELGAQVAKLNYPATAVAVKERKTQKAWEWEGQKKVPLGFSSSAMLSLNLPALTNYSRLLYIGTHEQYEIRWMRMSGSAEGLTRKNAIAEALQAARTKAVLLAEEGGAKLGKLIEVMEEEVELPEEGTGRIRNVGDAHAGTAAYPIEILVRVRAKFELNEK